MANSSFSPACPEACCPVLACCGQLGPRPLRQHGWKILTVAALRLALTQADKITACRDDGRQRKEGDHREARDQPKQHQQQTTYQQRLGLGHHLGANIGTQIGRLFGGDPGHDDPRGDGDQQRRHLGDHAITHRQDGVELQRIGGG